MFCNKQKLEMGDNMQTIVNLILKSGESGINTSLYILMPVMVIMMAFMRLIEKKGILQKIAVLTSPILIIFGLPGLGIFAILQVLLVSFAAPLTTFKIIEQDKGISLSMTASTLAAVLVMSQANAIFPLAVVGLNVFVIILTSILGGLLAAFVAYKLTKKYNTGDESCSNKININVGTKKENIVRILFDGGGEGLDIALKSIPPLVLSIFLVNILRDIGAINLVEKLTSPFFALIDIPSIAVLPIISKYLAGGTAMMAVVLDLVKEGALTAVELNRMAGMTINVLDPVGVAILVSAGPKVATVAKPAIIGAIFGILLRAVLHLIIF